MIDKLRNGPFGIRAFALLSAGQSASTLGDGCYAIALPWFVLTAHGSAILLGTVLACYGIPRMVLIPAGGVLADKIGHRNVMLIADTARCVLVAVLAVLATGHTASIAWLGPVAALMGAGQGLFLPASYSILPSLVSADQLVAANGYFTALQEAGSLFGPAVGGTVVALASPAAAFAIDAVSFAVSAVTLALINVAPPAAAAAEAEPGTGGVLTVVRTSAVLQTILLVVVTANLALGGLSEVAVPALAHERFGAGGYGAILACLAAGTVVGALLAGRTGGIRSPAPKATFAFIVAVTSMSLVPFAGGVVGATVAMVVMGAGIGLGNGMLIPRLQAWAPPELLGRLMSVVMLCSLGSFPLSVAVTGLFVHHFGAAAFFPVAGVCSGVVFAGALGSRQWRAFGSGGGDSDSEGAGAGDQEDTTDQAALVTPR